LASLTTIATWAVGVTGIPSGTAGVVYYGIALGELRRLGRRAPPEALPRPGAKMSNSPPTPRPAASPEDDGAHPNRRLARALLGLNGSQVPLRGGAVPMTRAPSSADEVGSHWLRLCAVTGLGRPNLQAAVSEGLVAAGQTGLAFHLLAQPLSMSPAGRQLTSPARRARAIDVLARMATEHLAPRDAEPSLDLPQAVIDGAQSALWLLRSDKRHWSAAQRLLLLRTEALRRQVASGSCAMPICRPRFGAAGAGSQRDLAAAGEPGGCRGAGPSAPGAGAAPAARLGGRGLACPTGV
jgi:hypothetical protein